MTGRRPWPLALALIGVLAAVAVFVWSQRDTRTAVELVERNGAEAVAASEVREPEPVERVPDDTALDDSALAVQAPAAPEELPAEDLAWPPVDVTGIAREPLSDDEFEALVEQLQSDPALLMALIDEARSETDPQRLDWLLRLLGEVDDPAVVALATELVYSGDPEQQTLGLELMKRVRPGDPDVLASVSGILSTEVNGGVLVPALTALARPGNTDAATRASLAGQVAVLVDHTDPSVRRTSLTILSRWDTDGTYTPQLLGGLDDREPSVRRAAAFAFVGHEDSSPAVRERLTRVASDSVSGEAARRGAILALKRMPLSDEERQQVLAIERQLDSRPVR